MTTTLVSSASLVGDAEENVMKALVYNGPGKMAVEERPKPEISAPTDAVAKLVKATICGTDLHILKGDVPTCTPGRILGHEGVGVVVEVGNAVTAFKPGDHVIILHLERLWDRNISITKAGRHRDDANAAEDGAIAQDRREKAYHPPL